MASDESKSNSSSYFTPMSDTPCFRNTFLTSISSGLAAGFVYFMFTSKPRAASHFGYGTFFLVTVGYWAQCRYRFSRDKFNYEQLMSAVKESSIMEGVEDAKSSVDIKTT